MKVYVGVSKTLGIRAVLASEDIAKETVIERCPVILLSKQEEDALFRTTLKSYYFEWTQTHHAILLGYGSLYNHSYTPNARYYHDYGGKCMVFAAIADIKKDEEITVNYNFHPQNKEPLESHLLNFNKHQKKV